ncbi:MAG: TRAP transporter small permease [Pseudorhodoplanes sp.]|uniref:TRAP transporter small permease n=1 Tax=Pseudorhodoplanes sp. TaxID=1934341 RepID=UPI003D0DC9EF
MPARLAAIVARFRTIAEWVTTAMLFAVFLIYLVGIAARYLFASPIAWSDELAMIVFLWCMFLTDAFVNRDADHVGFDILWERLQPSGRRVAGLLQTGLFGILFAAAFPVIVDYVMFLWREQTSALQWRLDLVYICFIIYFAMVIVRLAAKFVTLAGSGWREAVTDESPAAPDVVG